MRSLAAFAVGFIGIAGAHAADDAGAHRYTMQGGVFDGVLLDNMANAAGEGAGFHPLHTSLYPGKPIFRADRVGLNFEHVFNGAAADKELSMFTPRKDYCELLRRSDHEVTLRWPAERSAWSLDCAMTYTLHGNAIDLAFEVTPRAARFPLGYAAFMWASYMSRTRERCIHFPGRDGERTGWMTFGNDLADDFEKGTVSFAGVPDLPYEKDAQILNTVEHPTRKFTKPFYYGLIDGDNDLATTDDTLVYIMMFDQAAPMRFAVWNFLKDEKKRPDPHSPAWDWQFVIRDPQPGMTYRYRARVIVKRFVSAEDVEGEYEKWRSGL